MVSETNHQIDRSEYSQDKGEDAFAQLNARIIGANVLSQSLRSTLSRQHLDIPLDNNGCIKNLAPKEWSVMLSRSNILLEDLEFLRLEQIGMPVDADFSRHLHTFRCLLRACHKGCQRVIFLVVNDGSQNKIYLGFRKQPDKYSDHYIEDWGHFLQSNWKGSQFKSISSDELAQTNEWRLIQQALDRCKHAAAITGVPSASNSEKDATYNNFDLFLTGANKPFIYMVIAEPIDDSEVDKILYNLRDLMSRLHSLSKITFNDSLSRKILKTRGKTDSESIKHEETQHQSMERDSSGLLNLVEIGGSVFPPASFVSDFLKAKNEKNTSVRYSVSDATMHSVEYSETGGFSSGSAQEIGEEHINAHAKATLSKIEKYISRFEKALADGSWNTGVYFLGESKEDLQLLGEQFMSLSQDQNIPTEPLRFHPLDHIDKLSKSDGRKEISPSTMSFLKDFKQPYLGLEMQNAEPQTRHHPLSNIFNLLTTPVNGEELTKLINFPKHKVPGIGTCNDLN